MSKSLHDTFLEGLKEIQDTEVLLVSRLKDERLQYSFPDEVRVFIPDLHLVTDETAKTFKYTTNSLQTLERLIKYLIAFQKKQEQENKRVLVYQLGDLIDLYREGNTKWTSKHLNKWRGAIQFIIEERHNIIFPLLNELNATILMGNHDNILNKFDPFLSAKYSDYFPGTERSCVALHGHLFSEFEVNTPDWIKRLGVLSVFGRTKKPSIHGLDIMTKPSFDELVKDGLKKDEKESFKVSNKNLDLIAAGSEMLSEKEEHSRRYNVKRKGADDVDGHDLKFLDDAKKFFLEESEIDIRLVILGHSHHARIAIDETDGNFFALADCGAWTVNCSAKINNEGKKIKMPNMQLGVLSDNDMRIYHFRETS
jgi:UDP-2,3-diacylglucosamine pyrophosphatase LpxH